MVTSFFTPEDAHLVKDLESVTERTLINAQQEVPRWLQSMRVRKGGRESIPEA
jgi:hypothetical protein